MPGPGSTACPKPERRVTAKRRRDRREDAVAAGVRDECVERDGYCRVGRILAAVTFAAFGSEEERASALAAVAYLGACDGPSEWMHLLRKSASRGMAPEIRHATRTSMMGCRSHHQGPRGHERHGFEVEYLDEAAGANGDIRLVTRTGAAAVG